jgi:hypothetical protein
MGQAEDIRFDFIYCKTPMIKFFLGLGYRQYRGEIAHALYGQVTPMVLSLSDLHHQRIRSPLAKLCGPSLTSPTRARFTIREFSKWPIPSLDGFQDPCLQRQVTTRQVIGRINRRRRHTVVTDSEKILFGFSSSIFQ